MMDHQPIAYSYVRFSTPDQMKGDSLRRQTEAAEEYARRHGLLLDTTLTFRDLGVSGFRGRNAEVGRLGEFLQAVESGLVPPGSFLLVESLDRISRQAARKALKVLESIIETGVTVVTLADQRAYTAESIDTDPMSLIMALMVFIRAHEESAMKAKRIKASWEARRRRAHETLRPVGTVYPSWLSHTMDQGFMVVEAKASVVRRIFDSYLKGLGLNQIARCLNGDEVPTLKGAAHWSRGTVLSVLESPAVIGTYVPTECVTDSRGKLVRKPLDPIEGYFPAIVDRDTWDRVVSMRQGTRAPKVVKPSPPHVFAGLARCPKCDSIMGCTGGTLPVRRKFLRCQRVKTGAGCDARMVSLANAERTLYLNDYKLAGMLPDSSADVDHRLAELQAQMDTLDQRLANIAEALAHEPSRVLAATLMELEAAREVCRCEYRALSDTASSASRKAAVQRVRELSMLIQDGLVKGDVNRTRANALLRQVFDKIVVSPASLALHWKHAPGVVTSLNMIVKGPTPDEFPALIAGVTVAEPMRPKSMRRLRADAGA